MVVDRTPIRNRGAQSKKEKTKKPPKLNGILP